MDNYYLLIRRLVLPLLHAVGYLLTVPTTYPAPHVTPRTPCYALVLHLLLVGRGLGILWIHPRWTPSIYRSYGSVSRGGVSDGPVHLRCTVYYPRARVLGADARLGGVK